MDFGKFCSERSVLQIGSVELQGVTVAEAVVVAIVLGLIVYLAWLLWCFAYAVYVGWHKHG